MAILKQTSVSGDLTLNGSAGSNNILISNGTTINIKPTSAPTIINLGNIASPAANTVSIGSTSCGQNSVAIGIGATAGTGSIAIGNGANTNNNDDTVSIGVGGTSAQNATIESGSINFGIGGNLRGHIDSSGVYRQDSDYRDKTDFLDITHALTFIRSLEPKTYVYNRRNEYINPDGTFDQEAYELGTKKKHRRQAGFIAQDVYQKMIDEYHSDNYANIINYSKYDHPDGESDKYFISLPTLIPFLVKAIQEQQEKIEALESEIQKMKDNF